MLAQADGHRAPGRGHLQAGHGRVGYGQLCVPAEELAVDGDAGIEGGGAGAGSRGQAGATDGCHAGIAAVPAGIPHWLAAAIRQHGGRAVLLVQTDRRPELGRRQLQAGHSGAAHPQLRRAEKVLTIEVTRGHDGHGAGTQPPGLPPIILLIADRRCGSVAAAPADGVRDYLTGAIGQYRGGGEGQRQADRRRVQCRGHLQGGDGGIAHGELRRTADCLALEETARAQTGHARPNPGRQPLSDGGSAGVIAAPAQVAGHVQSGAIGELQDGGELLVQAGGHPGRRGRNLQPRGLGIADLQLRLRLDGGTIGPHPRCRDGDLARCDPGRQTTTGDGRDGAVTTVPLNVAERGHILHLAVAHHRLSRILQPQRHRDASLGRGDLQRDHGRRAIPGFRL
ncbi:hypothetical protein D3C72_514550 [compost metagenome]